MLKIYEEIKEYENNNLIDALLEGMEYIMNLIEDEENQCGIL